MIEETLNIFQKNRIRKKLELDFNIELIKSKESQQRKKFSKNFRNQLDILITELHNKGVFFYGFTINLPFLNLNDTNLWYYIHLQNEYWLSEFRDNVELIEFFYSSIEIKNQIKKKLKKEKNFLVNLDKINGVPQINGILGIRSLIGKNNDHYNEILKKYVNSHNNIVFTELCTKKAIKKYWDYIIKEENFRFHLFTHFSKFYDFIYSEISDLELQYDSEKEGRFAFLLNEDYSSKFSCLSGIQKFNVSINIIINYLVTIYMNDEKIFLSENFIYSKIENTMYSWKRIDSVEFFEKNKLSIFEKLKFKYPQHLNNLSISNFIMNGWNSFYNQIKKNNDYLPSVKIQKDVIEFNDGLYFLKENRFFVFGLQILNINCCLYLNKSYFEFKNDVPVQWLNFLSLKLNNITTKHYCENLGSFFNNFNIKIIKKKYLATTSNKSDFFFSIFVKPIEFDDIINNFEFNFFDSEINMICYRFVKESFNKKTYILYYFDNRSNILIDNFFFIKILINIFSYQLASKNNSKELFLLKNILNEELIKIIIYCNNLFFSKIKNIN